MRTKSFLLIVLFFATGATAGYAGSAIWSSAPTSGDWNTNANWVPATGAPNGSSDIATFDITTNANVSLSANTQVDAITFNPTASAYTITANPVFTLLISGTGVTNNSSSTQAFATAVDNSGHTGSITFENSAAVGSNVTFANTGAAVASDNGGMTSFNNMSSAGGATVNNNSASVSGGYGGQTNFNDASSAASAILNNNGATVTVLAATPYSAAAFEAGQTFFNSSSSAATATINNNSATVTGGAGGQTSFNSTSSAGSAILNNNGSTVATQGSYYAYEGGETYFYNSSSAATATINDESATVAGGIGGSAQFEDNSTAGNATINNSGTSFNSSNYQEYGRVDFSYYASAGTATINNNSATFSGGTGGNTIFSLSATAGNAIINNAGASVVSSSYYEPGETTFFDNTIAGSATINNNAATVTGGLGGSTFFDNSSSAGNSTIYNNGSAVVASAYDIEAGTTNFEQSSTAGNATIINNGATVAGGAGASTVFNANSSAGSATIIANNGVPGAGTFAAGGGIAFLYNSTGGTSRIEVFGNGFLDISGVDLDGSGVPTLTIGSIEGTGNVFLGTNNLTVGSNNMSTTFSGVMQDGGIFNNGPGGSLTKIGNGTLTLSGANTYTGGTLINAGTLVAAHDGALGSGNVSLTASSVTLTLQGGATNNYIADGATISIVSGAIADLNFTGSPDLVGDIVLNGVNETAAGTYGSLMSGAEFESSFFSGTGTLLLGSEPVPEPATWAAGTLAVASLALKRLRGRAR